MSLDVNISEPDEFNCSELHNCIQNVANIKEINDFTYHVDIVSGKAANYVANVFRIIIEETGTDKELSVIVKTLINTSRQDIFRDLHKREVLAYSKIIDKFVALQNYISFNDKVVLPKVIYTSVEKNNEVIVLEDMSLSGFTVDNKIAKFEKLDYLQVRSIVRELAKFHGLSFILEKKEDDLESIKNDFEDVVFSNKFLDKSKLRNYFFDSFQTSLNLINNTEVKIKLEQGKDGILDLLRIYTKPKKHYNVFCHGDCWINNILFKEDTEKICFLDFQAMRYASPATDLLYFLYICTDSEFRSEHFAALRTDYYDSLKTFLDLYDLDTNEIYPNDEFENDVRDMRPFGLLVALLELKLVTTSPDVVISPDNDDVISVEDNINVPEGEELYKSRVNDVIDESVANGVLSQLLQGLLK